MRDENQELSNYDDIRLPEFALSMAPVDGSSRKKKVRATTAFFPDRGVERWAPEKVHFDDPALLSGER